MTAWKHFTMEELTRSDVAKKLKINNIPNKCVMENLDALVTNVLEPLREYLGCPLRVSSGYRCEELNRLVGEGGEIVRETERRVGGAGPAELHIQYGNKIHQRR